MKMAARLDRMGQARYASLTKPSKAGPVWTGEMRFVEDVLTAPLKRRKPTKYFVNSMSDLFHESVPDEWIDRIFAVMALCPQHSFQVLTKRADRMRAYLTAEGVVRRIYEVAGSLRYEVAPDADKRSRAFHRWTAASAADVAWLREGGAAAEMFRRKEPDRSFPSWVRWPLPNIWLGVSVEDQRRADERIPDLLATPAAVRWISAEPLLGPVDLRNIRPQDRAEIDALRGMDFDQGLPCARLDWVVVGSESGPRARPCDVAWVRSIRDQCSAAGVSFFWKQHVEKGRKIALPELDGRKWADLPRATNAL